jgi:putative membrane protein
MFLTPVEADAIAAQVASIEWRTGAQVVAAVVGKSDTYVELPWKAFALGATAAALAIVIGDALHPAWVTAATPLLQAVFILAAGGVASLAAVMIPAFARLFLRAPRHHVEAHLHAQSLFLLHELHRAPQHTGVLILVSVFERRVEIVPDVGFRKRVSDADWDAIVARMTPRLRQEGPSHALQEALTAVETLLVDKGFRPLKASSQNLLDQPVEERGA